MPPPRFQVVENENVATTSTCTRSVACSRPAPTAPTCSVPVPVPCVLTVTQGSSLCHVEHEAAATISIVQEPLFSKGDIIRIQHPYHGADFEVSSSCIDETPSGNASATTITLTRPYDHTPITEREESAKRFDDAIERLHCPYKRASNDDDSGDDSASVSTAHSNSVAVMSTRSPKRILLEAASCNNDALESTAVSPLNADITLFGTRVWRLVAANADKRPPWRRQYDDGAAPSDITMPWDLNVHAEAQTRIITH